MLKNTTSVLSVAASDEDGDTPSYSIAGGADAALFTIDATSGALSFVNAPDFEAPGDAGSDNVYDVDVSASDGNGGSVTQSLQVTVTDVVENGSPQIVSSGSVSVSENQTGVVDVDASDDSDTEGSGLGYAITGGADASLFGIDASTGVLSFIAAPDFEAPGDADTDNVYDVQVTVTDSGGLSDVQDLTVTVGNANEDPVITSVSAISVAENTTSVLSVAASDEDGDTPSYSIAGGADAALFTIDATSGALSFVNAPDFEAPGDAGSDNVYDVDVSASDGNGGSVTQSLQVTVTDVVEGPSPNLVFGTEGSDRAVLGTDGDDIINSLGGRSDKITGFGGADVFDFSTSSDNGSRETRRITDFDVDEDSILLAEGVGITRVREVRDDTYLYLSNDRDVIILEDVSNFDTDSLL